MANELTKLISRYSSALSRAKRQSERAKYDTYRQRNVGRVAVLEAIVRDLKRVRSEVVGK